MKKNRKKFNENEITEILASTGMIFPRNKIELERFEILHGDNDFGLTGNEIDPDIILERNKIKVRNIKLPDVNAISYDYRLVARKDEENCKTDMEKIIKKPNKKGDQINNDFADINPYEKHVIDGVGFDGYLLQLYFKND